MSKTKQKLDQNTIHRVLKLIRPYTGMVILTLTLALITVVTTLLAPVLSGKAVDMILGPGQVDFAGLGKIAIATAATIACTALAQWLMNVVNNRITFQVVRDMRVQVRLSQLEILPLKYMDAHRPGDAISRITTDVEQFSDGLLMGFTQLFTGVLTIFGTLGVMLFIDWRIALVVVALTPLSIFRGAVHCHPHLFYVQGAERDPRRDRPAWWKSWSATSIWSARSATKAAPRNASTRSTSICRSAASRRRSSPLPRTPAPAL